MNQLELLFKSYSFGDDDVLEISKYFELRHFKKGDFFLKQELLGDSLGFIQNGLFQFYVETDGNTITSYIAYRNDFILSIACFFANQPSKENIIALVDSDVWIISKTNFKALQENINGFKEFYVLVLEKLLVCIDESRFDYITLKPEDRYLKLIREEPELLQQVSLKYLSALIGVTPRHLSRIRKNVR